MNLMKQFIYKIDILKRIYINIINKEINETRVLLKCIPSIVVTLFVVSVICMKKDVLKNTSFFAGR